MLGKIFILLSVIALAQAKARTHVDPVCRSLQFQRQLVSHEDCNKFYQCSNGIAVVQKCATDLHFNFEKQICDHPEYANCKTGLPGVDEPDSNDAGYEQEATVECLADNSEGTLLPHENCNQFYKCAHSVPVDQNCPPGLNYDPVKHICDWANNVNCDDRKTGASKEKDDVESNANEPAVICASGSSDSGVRRLPHEDCNYFYECNAGIAEVLLCPDGLFYNAKEERCGKLKDAQCRKNGRRKGLKHRQMNDLYKVK